MVSTNRIEQLFRKKKEKKKKKITWQLIKGIYPVVRSRNGLSMYYYTVAVDRTVRINHDYGV